MTKRSERKPEVDAKLNRLRQRMSDQGVDAVLINQTANIAWITAGAATYIHEASDTGPVSVLVTGDRAYALTDVIEAPRLRQEQALEALGFEMVAEPWYDSGKAVKSLTANLRLAQDGPGGSAHLGVTLQQLRSTLQAEEIARLRLAGRLAAEVMDEAIRATKPGDSEHLLAARLASGARVRSGIAVVDLIASDERIFQYRHPLPADKKVEKYAMLVLCFRYEGLIVSITRLIHFGPLPGELQAKADAVARSDARVILGTRAGRTMGDMFELLRQAYKDEKFPEAIEEHHQGGSAAYSPREIIAHPGDPTPIEVNQVFAWNPSIRGVKSEDTVLLGPSGPEVVSVIPGWPTQKVTVGGQSIERPVILIV